MWFPLWNKFKGVLETKNNFKNNDCAFCGYFKRQFQCFLVLVPEKSQAMRWSSNWSTFSHSYIYCLVLGSNSWRIHRGQMKNVKSEKCQSIQGHQPRLFSWKKLKRSEKGSHDCISLTLALTISNSSFKNGHILLKLVNV